MSENWQGENHHRWMEGETEYSGRWWKGRQLALKRDDYSCQSCGTTKGEIGREPDVHPIKPVRVFDDPQDAHYLDNVVCLCRTCHPRVEWGLLPVPEIE